MTITNSTSREAKEKKLSDQKLLTIDRNAQLPTYRVHVNTKQQPSQVFSKHFSQVESFEEGKDKLVALQNTLDVEAGKVA